MGLKKLALTLIIGVASPAMVLAQAPGGYQAGGQGYNQRLGIVNAQGSYYRYYAPQGGWGYYGYQGDPSLQQRLRSDLNQWQRRQQGGRASTPSKSYRRPRTMYRRSYFKGGHAG